MYKGIQDSLWENMLKSVFLVIAFPALLCIITVLILFLAVEPEWWSTTTFSDALYMSSDVFLILWPVIVLWWIISFFFHRRIVFSFAWAKPISRRENPEIYNIVENLCISRWLSVPKIWIIPDDHMNAFALGWHPKHAWIVFSQWLLDKLNKDEIEAVAAHELTHIINKDSLLMIVVVVFIGIIGTLWHVLIRVRGRDSGGKWNFLPLIGIGLLILWYLVYPLIRLAISRKREFLADAGSVALTKDKYAMISALEKISGKPNISIKNDSIASMCIANPLSWKQWKSFLRNLFATHPPIEKRIQALKSY